MTRQLDAWADDVRNNDKQQHRALWHYINWPFKHGQPSSVQIREPRGSISRLCLCPEGESGTKSRAQRNRILSWTWSAGVAQVPPDSISRFCVGAAGAISVQLNWTRNPIFRGW